MIDAAANDALDALEACPCCLLGPQQRCLNTPYTHLNITEIYADMLKECFNIRLDVASDVCGICEECVLRLRDASHFKRQVQRSQVQLRERLARALKIIEAVPPAMVKTEIADEDGGSANLLEAVPPAVVKEEIADEDGESANLSGEEADVKSEAADDDGTSDDSLVPRCDSGSAHALCLSARARQQLAMTCSVRLERLRDEDHEHTRDTSGTQLTSKLTLTLQEHTGTYFCDIGSKTFSSLFTKHVTSYENSAEQVDEKLKRITQSTTQHRQEDAEVEDEIKKVQPEAEEGLLQDKVTLSDEGSMKGKRVRQRDYCFYCETHVLNFARHMIRNHPAEPEVQKALAAPKNSVNRKKLFRDLQKKGNYISNVQSSFKPIKMSRFSDKTDYLPCTKCLGFYSKKLLWRHIKTCDRNLPTNKAQVHAQNFLLRNVKVDKNLMNEVFPRMKPDKISLIAKKDSLICMFGAQYLRSHLEHHFATVVSRKMRELAKLFVEVSKLKPHIVSLEQALRPQYYDTLVNATKIVARYNETSRQFGALTYAMNIATSLKQCCSIALLHCCKTEATVNTAGVQADLKTLSTLIGDNWRYDLSSQASDDLNVKKWNKTPIGPLASDLKLFIDYLSKVAKQAADSMAQAKQAADRMAQAKQAADSIAQAKQAADSMAQAKENIEAFNNLMESTYCRILLLNRRRPEELQRIKLSDYMNHGNESNTYQEFDKVLSPTEKILVDQLKRIVIRGKGGRGVPVLFSAEIQNDIQKILDVRHLHIENDNNMLFVKAGGTACDYKTLEKHAKASGVENYEGLSATRLRKHLATMTQLFIMNESELEQLATFIGHTLNVHKENYRLPNDVYQAAKISKLLLLIEDGQADKYQGKTLDQINLNMNEELVGEQIENEEVVDFELTDESPISRLEGKSSNDPLNHSSLAKEIPLQKTTNKKPTKKRTLIPWGSEQKNVVTKYFKDHIKSKKPPKRAECDALKNKYSELLQNKDWLKIKVYVQNCYTKR